MKDLFKIFRKFLYPLAILYDGVTQLRNKLYDKGLLTSYTFNFPIIAVGNLSVGGTGKTPMIEYLVRLLSSDYRLATLSRGYKRKSAGFVLANATTLMEEIGDEPYQYYSKFSNITVAVDADRVNGVEQIMNMKPSTDVVLLDDAYQHRKIAAGFYILLTAYDELYINDFVLPAGNLRESRRNAQRSNIIVVTKCPADLSVNEQESIIKKINLPHKKVFFTTISYAPEVFNTKKSIALNDLGDDFIAVAGIAKPTYFYKHLKLTKEKYLTFPDHHHFSTEDILRILEKANGRKIITTEKDYMRLQHLIDKSQLYYLPIEMKFLSDAQEFNQIIKDYVAKNSRNSSVFKTKK